MTDTRTVIHQAIAGVSPSRATERTVTYEVPSIGKTWLGRGLGMLFEALPPVGLGSVITIRGIAILLAIPLLLLASALLFLPFLCVRYRLTNRRVLIETGYTGRLIAEIPLDGFDQIAVDVLSGQAWTYSGDLVFTKSGQEVFRLPSVLRPQNFRHSCDDAHRVFVALLRIEPKKPG